MESFISTVRLWLWWVLK